MRAVLSPAAWGPLHPPRAGRILEVVAPGCDAHWAYLVRGALPQPGGVALDAQRKRIYTF